MRLCCIDSDDAVGELGGGEVCSEGGTPSTGGERRSMIGLFPGKGTVGVSVARDVPSIGVIGVIAFSKV